MKEFFYLFKHQLDQREFKICFGIMLGIQCIAFFHTCFIEYTSYLMQNYRDASEKFVLMDPGIKGIGALMQMVYPLLVVMICAISTKREEQNKQALLYIMRMGKRKYIGMNAAVTVIVTSGSVALSLLVNQLLCMFAFPLSGGESIEAIPEYFKAIEDRTGQICGGLYDVHPYQYNLCMILIVAVTSGMIALWTYAFTLIKRIQGMKYFIFGLMSYAICEVITFMAILLKQTEFSLLSYFFPVDMNVTIGQWGVLVLVLYICGGVAVWRGQRTYEYL